MSKPLPRIPEQFAKLAALAERSTFPAERDTARRKAKAALPSEVGGYDRALRILAYQAVMAKADPRNLFAGMDEFHEIDNPGHMARCRVAADEKLRRWHERRAALVERYGSLEAVLELCEREKVLTKALKPWRVLGKPPHQRWTQDLKGWGSLSLASKMPSDMRAAVEAALPWPSTFAEARAELAYWRERSEDMEHALSTSVQFLGDGGLDRVCIARMEIIRDFVDHEMRLHTLPEILDRFRIFRDRDIQEPDIEVALLRDLEALAAREAVAPDRRPPAPVTNRPDLIGQIRNALGTDPSRSDRAIARALDCSPTTVGQVRGQMGLTGVKRSVQRGGQTYSMGGRSTSAGEAA